MKKSIVLLIMSLSVNLSFAQFIRPSGAGEESQKIEQSLKKEQKILLNVATLNALWTGYGFYCKIDPEIVKFMHDEFIKSIPGKLKNELDRKLVMDKYDAVFKVAKEKGPTYSQGSTNNSNDCQKIKQEYENMVKSYENKGINVPTTTKQLINNNVNSVIIRKNKEVNDPLNNIK